MNRLLAERREEKQKIMATSLKKHKADSCFLTRVDSIAWLFNVRAEDVPCTPLCLSTVLLRADGRATWFVDGAKLSSEGARGA